MRSNNYIVTRVKLQYDLSNRIKSMIHSSEQLQTYSDLEQHIYEILLNMDNERLNILYEDNKLRSFISQIIKNQRNIKYSYYSKILLNHDELSDYDSPEIDEHNYKIDFVIDLIESIDFFLTGQTQSQLRKDMSLTILKLYIIEEEPKWKLCNKYQIGISTLNLLIKDGKRYIREAWEKDGELYIQKLKMKNGNLNIDDDTF